METDAHCSGMKKAKKKKDRKGGGEKKDLQYLMILFDSSS